MTPTKLRSHTYKDLAQMAKSQGVSGWHSMRKEELIRALMKEATRKRSKKRTRSARENHQPIPRISARPLNSRDNHSQCDTVPSQKQMQARLEAFKNLSANSDSCNSREASDRLVVMVRDPYWLHAYWELSPKSIERSRSALGQNWHSARPILRVFRVVEDGMATVYREISIHGGVNHWYIDVEDPPCQYRVEIGYVSEDGGFYCLAKSNTVTTPTPGASDSIDENWSDVADNADRIYAMSGGYSPQGTSLELQELLEERLQRPMGNPVQTRYGDGAARILFKPDDLRLAIDAELVIYGVSHAQAHLTVKGEPVQVNADGTFSVRLALPDRRQVVPVVASAPDGSEQRTVILAVERNTKVMEPLHRDPGLVRNHK